MLLFLVAHRNGRDSNTSVHGEKLHHGLWVQEGVRHQVSTRQVHDHVIVNLEDGEGN